MVPEAEVEVFDSLNISLGTGWMVLEAARMIEGGQELSQILSRLEKIRNGSCFFFTPATLRYLQMSGRVGRLQGALGSLLQVKPIISLEDGVLEAGENVRTRAKAVDRLIELAEESLGISDPVNMAVVHASALEEGRALLERVKAKFNCQETLFADLVASLTVHGGPGILMVTGYRV
jgi:DegV family protein with EDD domain